MPAAVRIAGQGVRGNEASSREWNACKRTPHADAVRHASRAKLKGGQAGVGNALADALAQAECVLIAWIALVPLRTQGGPGEPEQPPISERDKSHGTRWSPRRSAACRDRRPS